MSLRLNAIFSLYAMLIPEAMFTPHNNFGFTLVLEATFSALNHYLQAPAILHIYIQGK